MSMCVDTMEQRHIGLARIRTAIAGFRAQSANRYTTRPLAVQQRLDASRQTSMLFGEKQHVPICPGAVVLIGIARARGGAGS